MLEGIAQIVWQRLYVSILILTENFISVLPGIISAGIVILIGYVFALGIGSLVRSVLYKINLDKRLRREDLDDSLGPVSLSKLFGTIATWYVFIIFLSRAVDLVEVGVVSVFLRGVVLWLPNLIAAIIMMLFGVIAADYAAERVKDIKAVGIGVVANIVRWAIIIVVGLIAIEQIGVNVSLAKSLLLLFFGSIIFAFALAIGIGFGLAIKDEAKSIIRDLRKSLK